MALSAVHVEAEGPVSSEAVRSWSHLWGSTHAADSVWFPVECTSFSGRVRRRRLVDLTILDVRADPFGARWKPDSPFARFVGASVNLQQFSERVVLDDRTERVLSTPIDLWDGAGLIESELLTPMAQTVIMVPKSALPLRSGSTRGMREAMLDQDRASLRLLREMLLLVAREAGHLGPAATAATRHMVIELFVSVIADRTMSASDAAVSEAMRAAICRWVDDHLHLGQPSPAEAAHQHGISVRSLHRLFTGTGETFGSMVRRRRLERALSDVIATDDMVQTIAMRWGYADASQFICEFKKVHGETPRAFRQARRGSDREHATA